MDSCPFMSSILSIISDYIIDTGEDILGLCHFIASIVSIISIVYISRLYNIIDTGEEIQWIHITLYSHIHILHIPHIISTRTRTYGIDKDSWY